MEILFLPFGVIVLIVVARLLFPSWKNNTANNQTTQSLDDVGNQHDEAVDDQQFLLNYTTRSNINILNQTNIDQQMLDQPTIPTDTPQLPPVDSQS